MRIPLFPLKTVLFPGGLLPLKVFEQRYVDMTKTCLADDRPFGVVLMTLGDEVARPGGGPQRFAGVGTLARITGWDVPQLGILHLATVGETRFKVESHAIEPSGLVVAQVKPIAAEPSVAITAAQQPMVRLLELIAARIGPANFPAQAAWDDASWIGYRLAELLPLPLPVKQSMLEINDAGVRMTVLRKFLADQGLI